MPHWSPVLVTCLRLTLAWWIYFRKHNIYIFIYLNILPFLNIKMVQVAEKNPRRWQGPRLNTKTVFPRYGIPMFKIRRSRETVLCLTWWSLYWTDVIFILRRPLNPSIMHIQYYGLLEAWRRKYRKHDKQWYWHSCPGISPLNKRNIQDLLTITTVVDQHVSLFTITALSRADAVRAKGNIGTRGWN